jgi:hypothetical protein
MTAHYEEAATCLGNASICSSLWVERTYEIYCSAFWNYLLRNYATCTQDLRFHHFDTVPANSVLVQQGASHWKAGRMLSRDQVDTNTPVDTYMDETPPAPAREAPAQEILRADMMSLALDEAASACFSSYRQMLRSYAVDLATLPES